MTSLFYSYIIIHPLIVLLPPILFFAFCVSLVNKDPTHTPAHISVPLT